MISRRPASVAATAALTVAVLLAGAMPAHAEDELQVSRDGDSWSSTLHRPLFDRDRQWVPGDAVEETFWVRNAAATAGSLSIMVEAPEDQPLVSSGLLRFAVRGPKTDWVPISRLGEQHRLRLELSPEEEVQVFVRATILPMTGNAHQKGQAGFRVHATLSDRAGEPSTPPGEPTDGPGDVPDDGLPDTGAPAALWLLPLGAAAAGVGAALVRRDRSRKGTRHG